MSRRRPTSDKHPAPQRPPLPLFLAACCLLLAVTLSCVPDQAAPTRQKPRTSCLDCHKEWGQRFSSGNRHAPLDTKGCSACHLPHGLIGGTNLRLPVPELCLSCHRKVESERRANGVHPPTGKGPCTQCHAPHNSPNPHLLTEKDPELCFRCHDRKGFQKTAPHAPLATGCLPCHSGHVSKDARLLKDAADSLCLSCHRPEDGTIVGAHFGFRLTSGCGQCHTPHSSEKGGLLRSSLHEPVRRGQCAACHPGADGENLTPAADPESSCSRCHDLGRPRHRGVQKGKCGACHLPHGSDQPVLFRSSPQVVCTACHPKVNEGRLVHAPSGNGGCLTCHAGHEGGLRKHVPALCADCHTQKGRGAGHSPYVEGDCLLCHAAHAGNDGLMRDTPRQICGSCHPATRKTTGGLSSHQPFTLGECSRCHAPHGNSGKGFLKEQGARLCQGCHADDATARHAPYQEQKCDRCHLPHNSSAPSLLAKPVQELCAGCHTPPPKENGAIPHQPYSKGECLACHSGHGGSERPLTGVEPKLCLGCHQTVAADWIDGAAHAPALANCTASCHSPHQSTVPHLLKDTPGKLCAGCHLFATEAMAAAHRNIPLEGKGCTGCHDPHGGRDKRLLLPVLHPPFATGRCSPCHEGNR